MEIVELVGKPKSKRLRTREPFTRPGKRGGSVATPIDIGLVERLAATFHTYEEIATMIGMTVEGLIKRRKKEPEINAAIQRGRAKGTNALRSAQMRKAVTDGNVPMLIHLGKNYLGQKDKTETQIVGDPNRPIIVQTKQTLRMLSAETIQQMRDELQEAMGATDAEFEEVESDSEAD